jgi:ABC-type Fe3+-siderophore transport system permease subunit
MLQAYRDNPRAILLTLAVFTTLNLADLLLTLQSLSLGAREANPAMKALFDVHPMWAGVVKMGVGMVGAEIIWTWRRHRAALALSIGITVAMAGILAWHLFISQRLLL